MASYPRTRRRPSPAPRYHADDAPPRRRQSPLSQAVNWAINLAIVAFIAVTFYLIWPAAVARWQGTSDTPADQLPAPPLSAPQQQPRAAEGDQDTSAPIDAPLAVGPLTQPQSQVDAPVVAPTIPTAEIVVPTPAVIVRPDPANPPRYAPGSIVPTAAPAPTVAYTAPMALGKDYTVSADGRCVMTTNTHGQRVQFCQDAEWTPGARSSVADYLRTGMIAGEEVK